MVENLFGQLTESRGTNEDKLLNNAYHGHHAGGFAHVFVRVLSSENAGGGRASLPNDSRSGIVHAALYQHYLRCRWFNARFNPRPCREDSTYNKTGADPAPDLHLP